MEIAGCSYEIWNYQEKSNRLQSESEIEENIVKVLDNFKNIQEIYSENINFFKKKNININYNNFIKINKKETKDKVVIFYLRNLVHKLDANRNTNIKSIGKSINYLLKKNYKITIASDFNRNILNNCNYCKKITYLNLNMYLLFKVIMLKTIQFVYQFKSLLLKSIGESVDGKEEALKLYLKLLSI